LDFADHQAFGVSGEEQAHDAEAGLGSHGGEHVGVAGYVLGLLSGSHYFYDSRNMEVCNRKVFTRVCVNTGAWYTHRTGRIVDTFRSFFLAPQAIGAVGKWESCFWISTFPPHPVLQPGLFG
jgi:hypothetical protein